MNRYDADIVARDGALPGLPLLLDSKRLLTALRSLPALQDVGAITVNYLRYKPGTSCVAGLLLTQADGSALPCFVKAFTLARFAQSWQHPRRQRLIAAGDERAPLALPDWAIMLQYPEYDFSLRYLNQLMDADMRAASLRDLLPAGIDPYSVEWRFLRYKPERRAVIKLSCQGAPLAVLRIASNSEYGRILQGSAVGAALGHIELTGMDGHRRMLATRWLNGVSLAPEANAAPAPAEMSAAGAALAQLHQSPFTLPAVRSRENDIQMLWWVFNTFVAIYPAGAERFQAQARRIARHIAALDDQPVLIHGDFSADQVVKGSDGTLRFIDWDRCTCGSALADLASFCARLEMQAIAGQIAPQQAAAAVNAFLAGYGAQRLHDRRGLACYSAWALLCLASEPFRLRTADWPQQTEKLLARVAWLMDEGERISHSGTPGEKRLAALVNPTLIAQPLLQALQLPANSQLQQCQIRRHKPGRRAMIEYQIALPDRLTPWQVLGKYRAKGLDPHPFRCQQALWQQGFNNEAQVAVPRPLALLPRWQIWLQEKVDALPLTTLLQPEQAQLAAIGQRVGTALARMQQSSALQKAVNAKRWQIGDELAVLQRGLRQVAAQHPQWQTRLSHLYFACETLAQSLTREIQRPVHRDFYHDQVMVNRHHPQQVILVDFDLCCLSFAALDAGNYLAHIRELALRVYRNANALKLHEQAFTRAFLAESQDVSLPVIKKFTVLSLARHIFLSTQFADRSHTTSDLIADCERALTAWHNVE